jgi:hypothetical protein
MFPWTLGAAFADTAASWLWNEIQASLKAEEGKMVRFYKFIDRDELMDRNAPVHRAFVHIIADADTTCTISFNNATLGVFTGGYDNKTYPRIPIELPTVAPFFLVDVLWTPGMKFPGVRNEISGRPDFRASRACIQN